MIWQFSHPYFLFFFRFRLTLSQFFEWENCHVLSSQFLLFISILLNSFAIIFVHHLLTSDLMNVSISGRNCLKIRIGRLRPQSMPHKICLGSSHYYHGTSPQHIIKYRSRAWCIEAWSHGSLSSVTILSVLPMEYSSNPEYLVMPSCIQHYCVLTAEGAYIASTKWQGGIIWRCWPNNISNSPIRVGSAKWKLPLNSP